MRRVRTVLKKPQALRRYIDGLMQELPQRVFFFITDRTWGCECAVWKVSRSTLLIKVRDAQGISELCVGREFPLSAIQTGTLFYRTYLNEELDTDDFEMKFRTASFLHRIYRESMHAQAHETIRVCA